MVISLVVACTGAGVAGGTTCCLTAAAALWALPSFKRSGGQWQSKQRRRQSPHLGLTSSHFFFRCLHIRHPVWTRRILALGAWAEASGRLKGGEAVSGEFLDRHGKLRRVQREQGMLPSQACLICAQRWQTGRRSVVMACVLAIVGCVYERERKKERVLIDGDL